MPVNGNQLTKIIAACKNFKDLFLGEMFGSVSNAVIEIVPIFDPEDQDPEAESITLQQLVHKDSTGDHIINYIIPLCDDYLLRFFDVDQRRAVLATPRVGQYIKFSDECHQGLTCNAAGKFCNNTRCFHRLGVSQTAPSRESHNRATRFQIGVFYKCRNDQTVQCN